MTDAVERPPIYTEILDLGEGRYSLMVDNSEVVKLDYVANMQEWQMRWQIYGPCDARRSIAIMQGFLQLTALMGAGEAERVAPRTTERRRTTTTGDDHVTSDDHDTRSKSASRKQSDATTGRRFRRPVIRRKQ